MKEKIGDIFHLHARRHRHHLRARPAPQALLWNRLAVRQTPLE